MKMIAPIVLMEIDDWDVALVNTTIIEKHFQVI
jgi:hypothetical protein